MREVEMSRSYLPTPQPVIDAGHIEQLRQRIAELEAQTPEGMKTCTIEFKECVVGHGRLTATNWIDNECPWCRIAELEADNDTLQVLYKGALKDLEDQAADIEWQKAAKNSLASRLTDCQAENELYQSRIQAMYDALVSSGSINRIPEAHEWAEK